MYSQLWFINWTFSVAVHVWCEEIRDIRLWPNELYSPNFTEYFITGISSYGNGKCVNITKQQLEDHSLVFSFKLRYTLENPQIRIFGEDENLMCNGPICFNKSHPIVMVTAPAYIEPDYRNIFYPGSSACPFVRSVPTAATHIARCHFLCSCKGWVGADGFCDSQFVVVISSTVIPPNSNEIRLCGVRERTLWLPEWPYRLLGILGGRC